MQVLYHARSCYYGHMKKRTSAVIILIGLVGLIAIVAVERGGYLLSKVVAPPLTLVQNIKDSSAPPVASWEDYGRGVARREYWFKNSTQGRAILYRFDQRDFTARLVQRAPALLVRDWLALDAKETLVVNGEYFDEKDMPIGYTMIDGSRIGKGMLTGKTTTMVGLSPKVVLGVERNSVHDGFQTYPILVKNGRAAVVSDSKQYARRTFIGTDTVGSFYVGVIPDSSVSLYELAHVLVDTDIAWSMAVNLDGGPSTGLASRFSNHEEHFDSMTLIPNVLMVERR